MKMLRKLKFEITLVVLVIFAILGFFVYGKVREVLAIQYTEKSAIATVEAVEVNKELLSVLRGIETELARANCYTLAEGDAEEMAICN